MSAVENSIVLQLTDRSSNVDNAFIEPRLWESSRINGKTFHHDLWSPASGVSIDNFLIEFPT